MSFSADQEYQIAGMKKEIESYLKKDEFEEYYAVFEGRRVYSVYQPIFQVKADSVKCIGHEALFRFGDSLEPASPLGFMASLEYSRRYLFDRILRALHLRNFVKNSEASGLIFLNVDPGTYFDQKMMDNSFQLLVNRLHAIGIEANRLVLNLLKCHRSMKKS